MSVILTLNVNTFVALVFRHLFPINKDDNGGEQHCLSTNQVFVISVALYTGLCDI